MPRAFTATFARATMTSPSRAVIPTPTGSCAAGENNRAARNVADAHLIVAGDGEQRAQVDALGRQLLGNRFHRLTLARENMPDLYRAADALLHMSQDEPFGNIYVEALATGLPIVAHQTP